MTDAQAAPESGAGAFPDSLDYQEYLRLGVKYQRFLTCAVGACMLIAILYCVFAPKTWQSEISIKLPTEADNSLLQQLALSENNSNPVETYLEIAQSTNVVSRAAASVDLTATPEYADEDGFGAAIEKLKKHISVSRVKDSNIITIQVRAHDRALAVRLADAMGRAFVDANLDFSKIGAHSRGEAIQGEIGQIREQLAQSEQNLERASMRMKSLVSVNDGIQTGESAGQQDGNQALAPLVKLKTEIVDLKMLRAELESRYRPSHPSVLRINAEITAAQKLYDREMEKFSPDSMKFNRLSRDLKVGEGIYVLLLEKLKEQNIDEQANDTDIVIVDSAQVPIRPLGPRKLLVLVLTLFASAFLAINGVLLWDHFRLEVDDEKSLIRRSGLPLLALIPDWRIGLVAKPKAASAGPESVGRYYLVDDPVARNPAYIEAFKTLRANLSFAGFGRSGKALTVLSADEGEGKTQCVSNLAVVLAQSGARVLLCDADLRKPELHKLFAVEPRENQGLPLLLSGQGTVDSMVIPTRTKNLWLLPCGVVVPNPTELLGSDEMRKLVVKLKTRYDYVIFDAAPVLPVIDSVLLGTAVDGVVLAARCGTGLLLGVERAVERLRKGGVQLYGCVLNAVDMRRYSIVYGYKSSYSGYGK